jgi:hypothetical protein
MPALLTHCRRELFHGVWCLLLDPEFCQITSMESLLPVLTVSFAAFFLEYLCTWLIILKSTWQDNNLNMSQYSHSKCTES